MIKFKPEKTVRIALLHHHPVAPAKVVYKDGAPAPSSFLAKVKDFFLGTESVEPASTYDELMKMHNQDVFLRGFFACGVQLVLFGHQHMPYWRLIEAPLTQRVWRHRSAWPAAICARFTARQRCNTTPRGTAFMCSTSCPPRRLSGRKYLAYTASPRDRLLKRSLGQV